MPTSDEEYISAVKDLERLQRGAVELSVKLAKLTGDTRKQLAAIIFAKINLCALSIRKLVPDSPTIPGAEVHGKEVGREMFIDLSSTASLCRNLIEASNRLYYIGVEPLSVAEATMRLKISELYGVSGQISILRHLIATGPVLAELEKDRVELKKWLEADGEFQKLEKKVKKDILAGRMGEHLSQAQIAERRGRNVGAFRADYKYLSSHIHSDSLSLVDLVTAKAGGGLMTHATCERLTGILREATSYLALSVRDINELFPQFKMTGEGKKKLDEYIRRLR